MSGETEQEPSFRETEKALSSLHELLDVLKNGNAGSELGDKLEAFEHAYATINRFMRFLFEEVHDYDQPDGTYATYRKESVASEEIERVSSNDLRFKPTFIIGTWRSGTSLTASILNAHPEICAVPENELCRIMLAPPASSISDFIAPRNAGPIPIVHAYKTIEVMGETRSTLFRRWANLINEVYGDFARRQGKQRWVNKFVDGYHYLDVLDAIFGYQAQYIFVARHALDCAFSSSELYGRMEGAPIFVDGTLDIHTYIRHWVNSNEATADFTERNSSRCQTVRYEDLVLQSDAAIKRIFSFLGENCCPDILKRMAKEELARGLGDPKIFISGGAIDQSRMNRWHGWPAPLLRQLGRVANPTLLRLGYAPIEV